VVGATALKGEEWQVVFGDGLAAEQRSGSTWVEAVGRSDGLRMGGGSTWVEMIGRWRLAGTTIPSGGASDVFDFPLDGCLEWAVALCEVIVVVVGRSLKAGKVRAELSWAESVRQASIARTSLHSLYKILRHRGATTIGKVGHHGDGVSIRHGGAPGISLPEGRRGSCPPAAELATKQSDELVELILGGYMLGEEVGRVQITIHLSDFDAPGAHGLLHPEGVRIQVA
jgi:hypothetical protein